MYRLYQRPSNDWLAVLFSLGGGLYIKEYERSVFKRARLDNYYRGLISPQVFFWFSFVVRCTSGDLLKCSQGREKAIIIYQSVIICGHHKCCIKLLYIMSGVFYYQGQLKNVFNISDYITRLIISIALPPHVFKLHVEFEKRQMKNAKRK